MRKLLGIDRYGRVSQGEKTDNRQVFNNPAQMKNTDTADLKEQVHAIEKEEEKQNVKYDDNSHTHIGDNRNVDRILCHKRDVVGNMEAFEVRQALE